MGTVGATRGLSESSKVIPPGLGCHPRQEVLGPVADWQLWKRSPCWKLVLVKVLALVEKKGLGVGSDIPRTAQSPWEGWTVLALCP